MNYIPIKKIEVIKEKEEVWDITFINKNNFFINEPNFIANNIVVHNCHAGGIALSPISFSEICPLHITSNRLADKEESAETRGRNRKGEGKKDKKKSPQLATQFSMKDVESLGLIKFDVLGLSTLTAVDWCIKDLRQQGYKIPNMDSFPLDDPDTLSLLNSGNTIGCFQLENPGMQKALKDIHIDSFDDLVAVVAMYRPGPKQFIPLYAERKRNKSKINYIHPVVEKHTSDTYGVICFQEQCMQIFVELADLTNFEGYQFIKGSAKKDPKLFMSMKDIFIKGATKIAGKEIANNVFKQMQPFAGYAFNRTLYFSESIPTSKGKFTIEELFHINESKGQLPKVYSPSGKFLDIVNVYDHGIVPMYKVIFSDGSVHRCTIHHKFDSTSGVLPLYEIIKQNADIKINYGIRNGNKRNFYRSKVQISKLEYIGLCQGYDLEVMSSDHLYCLSSGIINSNSHSASYGLFSYITAWLKAHFPIQFMCNRVSIEAIQKRFDDIIMYERDCKRMGIEILPADINKSKIRYTVEGESSIRRSLLVMDVGIKAAQTIVDNQPYVGKDLLYSFSRKVGSAVNKRVMTGMYKAGMWDFMNMELDEILHSFETIRSDRKKNMGKQHGNMFE